MQYSLFSKIVFYGSLAFYNLLSPLECRNHRLKVLTNEFFFLFVTLGWKKLTVENKPNLLLKTRLGDYHIRNICWDLKAASPSFERLDIEELIHRISNSLANNHNVIFIDIGAQFGKYTVTIGNRFRNLSKKITIFAFEPDAENFSLLKENIHLNNLHNVKLFRRALSDKKTAQKFFYYAPQKMIVSCPTSRKITIKTDTLDNYLNNLTNVDNTEIFIKLDVEGHEIKVLKGGEKTFQRIINSTLLVEDSMCDNYQNLIRYLSSHGIFLTKKTAYNSFWKLRS